MNEMRQKTAFVIVLALGLLRTSGPGVERTADAQEATSPGEVVSVAATQDATAREVAVQDIESVAATAESELQARWEFFSPVQLSSRAVGGERVDKSKEGVAPFLDFVLGPSVFTHARPDLADLRLYDEGGRALPYALRYLRAQTVRERVSAQEFNRQSTEEGPTEMTFDLGEEEVQHNEVEAITNGDDFRRAMEAEGSDDGKTWRPLVKGFLVRYSRGEQRINLQSLLYPPSRQRYVRVKIFPDPAREKDEFSISSVQVLRQADVPAEVAMFAAKLEPREPVRSYGAPASAWILDLGGENVPCDRIEVEVADAEFARDLRIETEYGYGPGNRVFFSNVGMIGESLWRRRPGEKVKPMVATFQEVQTRRLKLIITDHKNPPLNIRAVRFGAPARQVVFAKPAGGAGDAKLYFGNPDAELPNYDFARNLPPKLEPIPERLVLAEVQRNPHFVPAPKAFTERYPWMIYVVLSGVIAFLGLVILSLSRSAIALHDARIAEESATPVR